MGGRMGMATVGKMALSPDHFNLPFDYAQLRLRPLSARAAQYTYISISNFHLRRMLNISDFLFLFYLIIYDIYIIQFVSND